MPTIASTPHGQLLANGAASDGSRRNFARTTLLAQPTEHRGNLAQQVRRTLLIERALSGAFFVAPVFFPHLGPQGHGDQPRNEDEEPEHAQHPDEALVPLRASLGDTLVGFVMPLVDRRLLPLSRFDPLGAQLDRELTVSTPGDDRIRVSRGRHMGSALRTDDRRQMHDSPHGITASR